MADDSFLTDSDDERTVEDLICQAMDHSVLEQIAAINCSSFSNSDHLPSDLEIRFRKLKSLPATTTTGGSRLPPSKSKSFTPQSGADLTSNERHLASSNSVDLKNCSERWSPAEHSDGDRDEGKGTNSRSKQEISKPKGLKSKSKYRTGSSESWSVSSLESESESTSVSPVRRRRGIGCLWCSPKKEKRKQGKENDYDVEFLETFSSKEQKKIMKKAMKEEEKINREAEKIVKWAKQASARMMDVDDDQLTDLEDTR